GRSVLRTHRRRNLVHLSPRIYRSLCVAIALAMIPARSHAAGLSAASGPSFAAGSAQASPRPHEKPGVPAASAGVYPIQEGLVDAGGVLIYYESVGRGAPLVILHGGPGASHDYFLPYLLPLARRNRLVFIDERGSGRSEQLDDP